MWNKAWCTCVWLTANVSLLVTLCVVVVLAILSVITTCCLYSRRRHIRHLICRSCPKLPSTCHYRQVILWSLLTTFCTFTQRRSVAKGVGCFQRRLFVCARVCLFVNTITSERVNIGRWNLQGRCIVQKSRPSLNLGVIAPWALIRKNVALGYDVGKTSAGCLVVFYLWNFCHHFIVATAFRQLANKRICYVTLSYAIGCMATLDSRYSQ